MKIGKLSEPVLKRTVIKEIKYKTKDVKQGAAVGNDASVFASCGRDMAVSMASYAGDIKMSAVRAFGGAVNSLSAKGAKPVGVMVSILMPEQVKETELRNAVAKLNSLGEMIKVQIAGGHTETAGNINNTVVTVNAFGYMYEEIEVKDKASDNIRGMDIVMAGETGLEGTSVLALKSEEELKARFSGGYIDRAKDFLREIFTVNEAAVAVRHGATAMHDTSKSGVFGALWELGEYLKCGMNIDLKSIPIRQETVEICEYFNMNPYFIPSLGGLIIVTKNGEALVHEIRKSGKRAEIIGYTTCGHDKAIINNGEKRFLEPHRAGNPEYGI